MSSSIEGKHMKSLVN